MLDVNIRNTKTRIMLERGEIPRQRPCYCERVSLKPELTVSVSIHNKNTSRVVFFEINCIRRTQCSVFYFRNICTVLSLFMCPYPSWGCIKNGVHYKLSLPNYNTCMHPRLIKTYPAGILVLLRFYLFICISAEQQTSFRKCDKYEQADH